MHHRFQRASLAPNRAMLRAGSKRSAWNYNDGSIRDFQRYTHQFTPGKNFPDTGAFGPWMMTPDELGDLAKKRIQTRLNGEVVQDALIEQMIFDIPRQIEYCSTFTRLEPGDVLVAGTPGGVLFSTQEFTAWAWRVPFVFSFALVLLGSYIRLQINESTLFRAAASRPAHPIRRRRISTRKQPTARRCRPVNPCRSQPCHW